MTDRELDKGSCLKQTITKRAVVYIVGFFVLSVAHLLPTTLRCICTG